MPEPEEAISIASHGNFSSTYSLTFRGIVLSQAAATLRYQKNQRGLTGEVMSLSFLQAHYFRNLGQLIVIVITQWMPDRITILDQILRSIENEDWAANGVLAGDPPEASFRRAAIRGGANSAEPHPEVHLLVHGAELQPRWHHLTATLGGATTSAV